jgi:hypothetical protein
VIEPEQTTGHGFEPARRIINLSGHPIVDTNYNILDGPVIGNVQMDNPEAVLDAADKLVGATVKYEHEGIPPVILPGMAPLAAIFLARFHGRLGFWPTIVWTIRVDNKFVLHDGVSMDLNSARQSARELRF